MPREINKILWFCVVGDNIFFLDVNRDSYFIFKTTGSLDVARYLLNLSLMSTSEIDQKWLDIEKNLRDNGIELSKNQICSLASPSASEVPYDDICGYRSAIRPTPTFSDAFKLFLAVLKAKFFLKYLSFSFIVSRTQKKKLRNKQNMNNQLNYVAMKVDIFNQLRPIYYTRTENCLFDSLSLMEYLSYYSIYPTWAFGIRTNPFYAHCWIELDGYVLNNRLDEVTLNKPIMHI